MLSPLKTPLLRNPEFGNGVIEPRRVASGGVAVVPNKTGEPGETARKFSDLEKRVLQLMSEGLTKKEIALTIHISVHTVNFHLRRVYEKLNVNTNTGAVARAIRENVI